MDLLPVPLCCLLAPVCRLQEILQALLFGLGSNFLLYTVPIPLVRIPSNSFQYFFNNGSILFLRSEYISFCCIPIKLFSTVNISSTIESACSDLLPFVFIPLGRQSIHFLRACAQQPIRVAFHACAYASYWDNTFKRI